jgi:hypothetical protein
LPRRRAVSRFALVCGAALAAALAGCSGSEQLLDSVKEGSFLAKPVDVFAKPDWMKTGNSGRSVSLGPSGPVALEELVGADGRCAPPVVEAAPAAPAPAQAAESAAAAEPPPPADRPVGSLAGDLAGAPMPAGPPPTPVAAAAPDTMPGLQPGGPQVIGGIALGMTECDAVRRAGVPGNVSIGAYDKGERKVVLTYLTGSWPGIYTFASGRLKVVERGPEPPAPPKASPKKKRTNKPAKPKTAAN